MKHQLRVYAAENLDVVLPYTSYPIGNSEYLGWYDGSRESCIAALKSRGYHYQLFAARKHLGEHKDVGSYARIATSHPPDVEETALEELDPRECQYHVHLFELNDRVELYGHYEIHPYPHTPTIDPTRSWPRHYRPTWDTDEDPRSEWTYLRGVSDNRLESLLE